MSPGFEVPEELQPEAARLAASYGATGEVTIRYSSVDQGFFYVFRADVPGDHLIDGAFHPMRRLTIDAVMLLVLTSVRGIASGKAPS